MASERLPELLPTTYRPDLDIFVGRWGYQPAAEVLPAAYERLTQAAVGSGCRFWLQDIRRRTLNDPAITNWLFTEYFPTMASRLGGRLCVAYLTGPTLLEIITNGPGYALPSAYDDKPYVVAFFGNEGDAMHWLQQEQRRELRH
jgi:hypothetical protein